MANWCFNQLRVTGPAPDIARFKAQAAGFNLGPSAEAGQPREVLKFQNLGPVPAELQGSAKQAARGDWLKQHWGCLSGTFESTVEDTWNGGLLFQFITAWSPPVPFLEHVSRQWPSLVFVLDYDEPRMAFQGLARAAAGSLQHLCVDLG